MFSGIVERTAKASKFKKEKGGLIIEFRQITGFQLKKGDSVLIDGICSTVENKTAGNFSFFFMPETLRRTNLSNIPGSHQFNLEKPLTVKSLISGHLLSGHIDTTAEVVAIKKEGKSLVLKFKINNKFTKYIIYKGSIAVNGVSLTVIDVGRDYFSVALIPYTIKNTNLGSSKVGYLVNIEVDMIAKYVEKLTGTA